MNQVINKEIVDFGYFYKNLRIFQRTNLKDRSDLLNAFLNATVSAEMLSVPIPIGFQNKYKSITSKSFSNPA